MTDAQAFERLVAEHELDVLRLCRSVLRDEHLGRDAAQETFARLWRALEAGHGPDRVRAWLRRAALSVAFDLERRRAARPLALGALEQAPDPEQDPTRAAHAAELRARLAHAVSALPDGQRTIFLLRHEGGYTLPEIAEALELALPTVKTQFARACLKLQPALRAFAPPEDRR